VYVGDWYTYQIRVINNGKDTAYDIDITDAWPGELEIFDMNNYGFDTSNYTINSFDGNIVDLAE
jgi:hypothetical protein